MIIPSEILQKGDALCIVDVQKDFCPGGALAIENGDSVVPIVNLWTRHAMEKGMPIYASRDWHPAGHMSFKDQGGPWPPHCIQDTEGAEFHPNLVLPEKIIKITKGVRFDMDQNSVFDQTGFDYQLKRDSIKRLWFSGLALDVCVIASVMDALRSGFEACLIREGARPVTVEGGEKAIEKMKSAGAKFI